MYKIQEIYNCKLCDFEAQPGRQSLFLGHLRTKHGIYRNRNFIIEYLSKFFNIPKCACQSCNFTPKLVRKGIEFNLFAQKCPNRGKFNNPARIEFYIFRGYGIDNAINKISKLQSKPVPTSRIKKMSADYSGANNPMSLNRLMERLGGIDNAKKYLAEKGKRYSGKNSPFYGKTHSEETLAKLAIVRSNIAKIVTKPELIVFGILSVIIDGFNESNFQCPIGRYIVDFKIDNKIIDVYGNYFHDTPKFKHCNKKDKHIKDENKNEYLRSLGLDVLILWENEIIKSTSKIASTIKEFLNENMFNKTNEQLSINKI